MTRSSVQIYAMRTWGLFGNLLAARTVDAAIRRAGTTDFDCVLRQGEDHFPLLEKIGRRIRAALDHGDAPTRRARYLALMGSVAKQLPQGFETHGGNHPDFDTPLQSLARRLAEERPEIVIGTKGILARLLVRAVRLAGVDTRVINFITNHGLLTLDVHVPLAVPTNVVQFDEGAAELARLGCRSAQIAQIPPIVAGARLSAFLTRDRAEAETSAISWSEAPDRPAMVVFCNHGGEAYVHLLAHVGRRFPDVSVLFIAPSDPALLQRARALRDTLAPRRWELVDELPHAAYLDRVAELGRMRHSLLVSKAGPNTVMESVNRLLPPVVLASGLPTEDWVMRLVTREGIGHAGRSLEELIEGVDRLLAEPERIALHKERTAAFRERQLGGRDYAEAIVGILRASPARMEVES